MGTGGGVGVDQAPDLAGLPVWIIVAIVAAIVVPLVIRAVVNAQRASALSTVAKGTYHARSHLGTAGSLAHVFPQHHPGAAVHRARGAQLARILALIPAQYQRWFLVAAFLANIWMRPGQRRRGTIPRFGFVRPSRRPMAQRPCS